MILVEVDHVVKKVKRHKIKYFFVFFFPELLLFNIVLIIRNFDLDNSLIKIINIFPERKDKLLKLLIKGLIIKSFDFNSKIIKIKLIILKEINLFILAFLLTTNKPHQQDSQQNINPNKYISKYSSRNIFITK